MIGPKEVPVDVKPLAYQEGYKYQVYEDFVFETGIIGHSSSIENFISMSDSGKLTIYKGYAWDGASGPALSTKNFRRGSLVHDALYQLIAEGLLPVTFRKVADNLLVSICKADGMWPFRRWYVWLAVHEFGTGHIDRTNPVLYIPEQAK